MFVPYSSEIWTKFLKNRIVQTTLNFELFDKNWVFHNRFWQRVDAILQDVSVAENIV